MEKEFGKIKKGTEDKYSMLLFPLEGNALKIYRSNPNSDSCRLREAIALVLFHIKERYTGEKYNVDSFRNEDNAKLENALLMAFDPFTNEEVKALLGTEMSPQQLHDYYKVPVMCLLRIKVSIDKWEKRAGSNGYFNFIEQYMGTEIEGNEMHFSVLAKVQNNM